MQRLKKKFVGIFLIICAGLRHNFVLCETWGNIYTTTLIDTVSVSKIGIPLFVREETVKFPAKYMENGSDQEKYVLHRIEHISHLDSFKCSPDITIISGGIYFPNVTLEIRSKRGCGLDSTLEFYGLEQKKPYPNFDLKI